jgi:hypothetical protein
MRVDPGESRVVVADRNEPAGRGGGFAGALERAGRPGRPERAREDDGEAMAPGNWTLDAILGEVASPGRSESMSNAAGAPLLARAIEHIVLLVKSGEAASVTLQLGPSLDVRIEQARAGVDVQIRAAHGLSPLAEAELPMLVAALRARGIQVARAGVAPRRREGRRSLTQRRSSATRAGDDGTVAKW